MDLLSIAILLQLRCAYFYCPVNRAQAGAAFMGLVLGGGYHLVQSLYFVFRRNRKQTAVTNIIHRQRMV